MEVSHGEAPATHTDPELCPAVRKDRGGALTGERAGRVVSRQRDLPRGSDAARRSRRPHRAHRDPEMRQGPALSEILSTHGSPSHGNPEIPGPPAANGAAGCVGGLRMHAGDWLWRAG